MSKGLPKHAYALKAGHKLGLYRVVRPLGAGGMGEVYLVEHVHMNKQYALKLLPADLAGDGEFIDRFRIEARVMADLEHPHIVRVHNFGEEDGVYYLIMDYVEGPDGAPRTLEDELAWGKALPDRAVKEIALQICDALSYAHAFKGEGVVHRDLKPANLLITRRGKGADAGYSIKISDFGLAKILGREYVKSVINRADSITGVQKPAEVSEDQPTEVANPKTSNERALLGTYDYMSPEQKTGATVDPRADIFSVGVMLYRMLTGHKPEGAFALPSKSGHDRMWDRIIARCLQRSLKDRYASVSALRADVVKVGRPFYLQPKIIGAAAGALVLLLLLGRSCGGRPEPRTVVVGSTTTVIHDTRSTESVALPFKVKIEPRGASLVVYRGGGSGFLQTRPAILRVDNITAPEQVLQLEAGLYSFSVSRSGYRPMVQEVVVGPEHRSWSCNLEEVYGFIRLQTDPGAEVALVAEGGEILKRVVADELGNVEPFRVLEGPYTLLLNKLHYAQVSRAVQVSEARPVELVLRLSALPGTLLIESDQPAEVWEANRFIGKTGEDIPGLSAGDHWLQIRRQGFVPQNLQVSVAAGERTVLQSARLAVESATLRISLAPAKGAPVPPVMPSSVSMRVNSEPWNNVTLPLSTQMFNLAQTQTIEVKIPKYQSMPPQQIRLRSGETRDMVFRVRPEPVKVRIVTDVPADVFMPDQPDRLAGIIDSVEGLLGMRGKIIGRTGQELELDPFVKHVFELRAPGRESKVIELSFDEPGKKYPEQRYELKKLPGNLTIDAEVPSFITRVPAVDLFVNDRKIGSLILPYTMSSIQEGSYTVRVEGTIWQAVPSKVVAVSNGMDAAVRFDLHPRPGWFDLRVLPEDARVYIDGREVKPGLSEVTPDNQHTIEVQKKGYTSYRRNHLVWYGATNSLYIPLRPLR
ncbi:MAG TPA: serine/threonine-protein kinase [Kiritimatiellia bacterium]|nr:serine/threonine-protein kinase [Kiritimatiellia bacterium]